MAWFFGRSWLFVAAVNGWGLTVQTAAANDPSNPAVPSARTSTTVTVESDKHIPTKPNPVDPATIDRLVRQLGDDSYTVRETASRELVELGEPVRGAIVAATQSHDAEVRARAEQIASMLDVVARELARRRLEEQLTEFVADETGKKKFDLPGWERFSKIIGDDKTTRQMFADLVRAEGEAMIIAAGDGKAGRAFLEKRFGDLQIELSGRVIVARANGNWQTAAALIWLAGRDEVELPPGADMVLMRLLYQAQTRETFQQPAERGPALRKLLGPWIARDDKNAAESAQAKINVATLFGLPEGAALARRLLEKEIKGLAPHIVLTCVRLIMRVGSEQDIPALEGLLTNETPVYTITINGRRTQTQIRDVALAGLVQLTKQEASGYHMHAAVNQANIPTNPYQLDPEMALEQAREEGLKKWKEWREKNPAKKEAGSGKTDAEKKAEDKSGEAKKVEEKKPNPTFNSGSAEATELPRPVPRLRLVPR